MAKVLGLVGSPRKGGNSEALLTKFLAGAQAAGAQVSKIRVAKLGLEGWTPKAECPDDGPSAAEDTYKFVSQELVAADVVAVGSPVYFANVPAQLKALIDLGQCQWTRKHVDGEPLPPSTGGHETRRGIFLSVGGQSRLDFEGAMRTIKSFFDVYEIDYWGELLFDDVDARDEIRDEPLALQRAYDLGFRAVAEDW